jgi:hypothetical protein
VRRQRIRQEVTTNWRNYIAAQSETASRKIQIEAAQQAMAGVREEARIGQRTVLDVLDADQELIDAKAAMVRAQRDETVALYALASSLGMLIPERLGLMDVASAPVILPPAANAMAPPPPVKPETAAPVPEVKHEAPPPQ